MENIKVTITVPLNTMIVIKESVEKNINGECNIRMKVTAPNCKNTLKEGGEPCQKYQQS